MASLDVDNVRLSDLSVGGWVVLALIAVTLGYGAVSVVGGNFSSAALMGFFAVILAFLVNEDTRPEFDTVCDSCGDHIRVQSSRDDVTECVLVRTTGAPRRLSYGSASVVLSRRKREYVYCTPTCADSDNRVAIGANDAVADTTAPGYEVSD